MDMQLVGLANASPVYPTLDAYVVPGATGTQIVPIITGVTEEAQQAQVLCTLVLNAIPQLPGVGADWFEFLSSYNINAIGYLDSQIRASLGLGGHSDYYPDYDIFNGVNLSVTANKQAALG